MKITLDELMAAIGYGKINVVVETPFMNNGYDLDIDHVSSTENGYYIEGSEGHFLEIFKNAVINKEYGAFNIDQDNCHICIKLDG